MLRVALSGGIASGKSSAAAMFRDLGVPVIDTDQIARDLVLPGEPALDALVASFGMRILDENGHLDRTRLRDRIFSDDHARERVNAILHPMILADLHKRLNEINAAYVVVEVPLLAETALAREFDRVLIIDVPEAVQLQRLRQRDGTSPDQAKAALAAQATREERLAIATEVIENTGTLDALRVAVSAQHHQYVAAAKRFASTPKRPSE